MYHKILIIILFQIITQQLSYAEFLQSAIDAGRVEQYNSDIGTPAAISNKIELTVRGKIPYWLNGTLVRNIPAKFAEGDSRILHWFDGLGMIAGFEINDGRILYHSAFLESNSYTETLKTGQLQLIGFAQNLGALNPKQKSRDGQAVMSVNPNVNLTEIDGRFVALGEIPLPLEFDLSTLNTIGLFDYNDILPKQKIWESAHIKRDPVDGSLYGHYTEFGWPRSEYVIYKIAKGSTGRIPIAKQKTFNASYMHDFSMTENYVVLTAYPLVVSDVQLLNSHSFIDAHTWKPNLGTKIYVFNKKDGKLVASLKTDPMFAFHHVNAFEENEFITIYLNASSGVSRFFSNSNYPKVNVDIDNLSTSLREMVIDLSNSLVKINTLSKEILDFSTINNKLLGKKNRYFYAVLFSGHKDGFGIAKYDLLNNKITSWFKNKNFAGEPLFIAKPNAIAEDDGVVVFMSNDAARRESWLFILDAKTMKELASAKLPQEIPTGLHGKFFGE